ncbi:MAG: zinc-binding dehydrogenase, partial [Flavobacteriales bacterium]|nr:zinc-binding dehydrogenase [Flavobacteriales bacterium]
LEFTKGRKVDHVVEGDFAVNLLFNLDVLRVGGVISCYASMSNTSPTIPYGRMMTMDLSIRMVMVYAMNDKAKRNAKEDITEMLELDLFIHRVSEVFPLAEIVKAHEAIERGKNYGTVIVEI